MSLDLVIDSVVNALRESTGVDQVLSDPPAKLPDDRCFIVYASPGNTTLMANGGRLRNAVYAADDDINIEFHIKAARDAMAEHYPAALAMMTQTRDALISALQRNSLATVHAFRGLDFPVFGPLEYWNADTSFGFSAVLSISHGTEVTGGRPA